MKYHVYHDQTDVLMISYGPPKLPKVNGKVMGIIIFYDIMTNSITTIYHYSMLWHYDMGSGWVGDRRIFEKWGRFRSKLESMTIRNAVQSPCAPTVRPACGQHATSMRPACHQRGTALCVQLRTPLDHPKSSTSFQTFQSINPYGPSLWYYGMGMRSQLRISMEYEIYINYVIFTFLRFFKDISTNIGSY